MKTRFCPSPTGLLHLGNLRTALFNVLAAGSEQGSFLVRIEDTDEERSRSEYVDALCQDLAWLGLTWQEGIDVEGPHGPYYQSQRAHIYTDALETLQTKGHAYPCFCTADELTLQRKIQRSSGRPPQYDRRCRHLSPEEIAQKKASGMPYTLRFYIPDDATVTFLDSVKGEQTFQGKDMGDFVIQRADGTAPFLLSNAIDDALMEVTHVLRGEDHLTNTPRQLLILKALGLSEPTYGHMTLIVGEDGAPLSKRHGSRSLSELRSLGYLPATILNYLARLGHVYVDNHLMALPELSEKFALTQLGRSAARYDEQQLLHWQKQAVLALSDTDFWQWAGVQDKVAEEKQTLFANTLRDNALFPKDVRAWVDILFGPVCFSANAHALFQETGKAFFELAASAWQDTPDWKAFLQTLKDQSGLKGKALFQPLRMLLTGQTEGPDLPSVVALLGPAAISSRIQMAQDLCDA